MLKFYADVHKTKKNGEGFRITYTTDGITFKHIDSFSEIPRKARRQAIHGYTTTQAYGWCYRTTKEGSRGLLS